MTARIPEGMSSVETFDALYRNANYVDPVYQYFPKEPPNKPWNMIQIFQSYCPGGNCDYVRGKYMKIDFSAFPKLDVNDYDTKYGQGSAQKAIDTYQKRMDNSDSIEKYDLNCEPCTYFTPYWKERTPKYQRTDLDHMFSACARLEESKKRILELMDKPNISRFFGECHVRYTLTRYTLLSQIANDNHHKPCEEALDHFRTLLKSERHQDMYIEGLSIWKYTVCPLPFPSKTRNWVPIESCQTLNIDVSLDTARAFVEAQIPKE